MKKSSIATTPSYPLNPPPAGVTFKVINLNLGWNGSDYDSPIRYSAEIYDSQYYSALQLKNYAEIAYGIVYIAVYYIASDTKDGWP